MDFKTIYVATLGPCALLVIIGIIYLSIPLILAGGVSGLLSGLYAIAEAISQAGRQTPHDQDE